MAKNRGDIIESTDVLMYMACQTAMHDTHESIAKTERIDGTDVLKSAKCVTARETTRNLMAAAGIALYQFDVFKNSDGQHRSNVHACSYIVINPCDFNPYYDNWLAEKRAELKAAGWTMKEYKQTIRDWREQGISEISKIMEEDGYVFFDRATAGLEGAPEKLIAALKGEEE